MAATGLNSEGASSLQKQFCLVSTLPRQGTNKGAKSRERACSGILWTWIAATGLNSEGASSLQKQFCLVSTLPRQGTNKRAKSRERACSGLLWTWVAATGLNSAGASSLQKQFCISLSLPRQVRPDWGQVTGKGLFGVFFEHGCYWVGAQQPRFHCKSSNPGLGPSHGKGLVWGCFGHYWFGALQGPLHCKNR